MCESQHEGTEQSEGSGKVTESLLSSNKKRIVCGQKESQEQAELWKSREHFLNTITLCSSSSFSEIKKF